MARVFAGYDYIDGERFSVYRDTNSGNCEWIDADGYSWGWNMCAGNISNPSAQQQQQQQQQQAPNQPVVQIASPRGWWDLLTVIPQTVTSLAALGVGAAYVPTTTHTQQPIINRPQLGTGDAPISAVANPGAALGFRLEQFVKDNMGLLIVGGVAFVLFRSGRK